MSQSANPSLRKDNEARAVTRMVRISPQKLNLLAASIRGLAVDKALAELSFSRKRHAATVRDTLKSAIANAENNHRLDIDALVVDRAYAGKNVTMKRIRPRARGRASRIVKPFSQLTIILRDVSMESVADVGKVGHGSES